MSASCAALVLHEAEEAQKDEDDDQGENETNDP